MEQRLILFIKNAHYIIFIKQKIKNDTTIHATTGIVSSSIVIFQKQKI